MREQDKHAFAVTLAAVVETFGGRLSEGLVEGYWLGLRHLSIEDVQLAARRALAEWEGPPLLPAPATLAKLAAPVSPESAAPLAWLAVTAAMQRHGRYASVDFEDPTINAAVRSMGGWVALCSRGGDDLDVWARKEFLRTYEALAQATHLPVEMLKPLDGLQALTNAGVFADHVPAPLRISSGTERRALAAVGATAPNKLMPGGDR